MTASPGSQRPVIVKLGGSVITRKRETERLRPKVLRRLCEELGSAGEKPLVILHGAGSFGHPGARKFGLASPPAPGDSPARRSRGASIVATEVRRLHIAVLQELVRAGLSVGSLPPSTHSLNRLGRLERLDASPFTTLLSSGHAPVSFGDVVPDAAWGWSILSADTIAVSLAAALAAERVIFVSDVPGVLAAGGKGRPEVLPELTPSLLERLDAGGAGPDVTGGIRGKVEAMLDIARGGVDAGLISGLKDGELSRAVRGEFVYGSWAHGQPGNPSGRVGD